MTMDDVTGPGMARGQASASKRRLHARPPAHWALGATIAITASFMLVACGGSDGATGPEGLPGSAGLNVLVRIHAELAGSHCLAGGNRIDAGLNANDSGVLD